MATSDVLPYVLVELFIVLAPREPLFSSHTDRVVLSNEIQDLVDGAVEAHIFILIHKKKH